MNDTEQIMNGKKLILFFEKSNLCYQIDKSFNNNGFEVFCTDDIDNAVYLIEAVNPHLIIIDWDYADAGFYKITKILKNNGNKTGLLALSKTKALEQRISALEEGADDCLIQPAEIDELIAKAKAIVRRINVNNNEPHTMKIRDIEINLDTHEVKKSGELLDLTYTQFKLLYLLASQREYIFSREEILKKVWGEKAVVTDRTVDVHVKRLREKLGECNGPLKYIHTIHGTGYRFA